MTFHARGVGERDKEVRKKFKFWGNQKKKMYSWAFLDKSVRYDFTLIWILALLASLDDSMCKLFVYTMSTSFSSISTYSLTFSSHLPPLHLGCRGAPAPSPINLPLNLSALLRMKCLAEATIFRAMPFASFRKVAVERVILDSDCRLIWFHSNNIYRSVLWR